MPSGASAPFRASLNRYVPPADIGRKKGEFTIRFASGEIAVRNVRLTVEGRTSK
jgi:hypothetical protein